MMSKPWGDYWKTHSSTDYRKLAFLAGIIFLIAIALMYSTNYKPVETPQPSPPPSPEPMPIIEIEPPAPISTQGNLIVAVKDVKQKLFGIDLGEATELVITIKSVQIHSKGNVTENRSVIDPGWTTIFEGEKAIDLLQFTNNTALITERELNPENYTQIRLYISTASIKIDNPLFEISNRTYPMYIPSSVLKIVRPFSVETNKTTVLTLDFDVPKMVSRTSQGYTFGPVFKSITDEIVVKEQQLEKGKKPENLVAV